MKLLFDENLPPRLAEVLTDLYPASAHVHERGLSSADDEVIWRYARDNGFVIVSKDSDFQERSVLRGHPPKVVWLRAANCTTAEIEHLLRTTSSLVTRFIEEDEESCLVLGVGRRTK